MTSDDSKKEECEGRASGIGGFLRSLLHGVPFSDRSEGTETLNFARPDVASVKIENTNGKTQVIGEDRDDIEVNAEKTARAESQEAADRLLEGITLIANETGSGLEFELEIPRRWNRHGTANLELRVPRDLAVEVYSSNGSVCISGMRSPVRARSSNGSVTVSNVEGAIDVQTSNGKIGCKCTCGRLVARSSNRKIELSEHRGSLDAMTSNGLIHASVEELGSDGVNLATSNGRIVVELPEKVDADVDMRVDNGVIRNTRELHKATRERSGRVRGRLGRGGSLIRLRTSNGSISLR